MGEEKGRACRWTPKYFCPLKEEERTDWACIACQVARISRQLEVLIVLGKEMRDMRKDF